MDAASDPAMFDEDGRGQDGKVRQAEDEIENDEFDAAPSDYHVSVSIQVSRQGKGAMVVAASLDQDARFNIDHVAYFPTLEMAEGKTAEHELSKRDVYTGPPFEELDEGLQTLFDDYLRERGIDESMGVFIPSYIQLKESKEYMRWMQSMCQRSYHAGCHTTLTSLQMLPNLSSDTRLRITMYRGTFALNKVGAIRTSSTLCSNRKQPSPDRPEDCSSLIL